MAEFLRPELRATLFKWREALAGVALLGVGLWLALARFGLITWLGWAIAVFGAVLIYTGVQHQRFRSAGLGPGIVRIVERRVAYMGPLTGGMVDMDLLARLELDPTGSPAHWTLTAETGTTLSIPVNAAGADRLFDLFAALPGIRTEAMLSALQSAPDTVVLIWEAGPKRIG